MKLCFPVIIDEGLNSRIYGHFSSAPMFVVVDTDTRQTTAIANCDRDNPYGGCSPFMALRAQKIDGIVVDGISDDALRTMNMAGFRVYEAQSSTVLENIELFMEKTFPELLVQNSHLEGTCSGKDACDHKCSHEH